MALLAEFAEDQWGMFTRAQAAAQGVARSTLHRMTTEGALQQVTHGVYRVRGGAAHPQSGLYAEWLRLDPPAPAWERDASSGVVSHQSAAACYEIGDLPAYTHEFSLTKRRQSSHGSLRFHRRVDLGLERIDWDWVLDMPITRPVHIIGDLIRDRQDPTAVANTAADALAKNLTSRDELIKAANRWGNPYGRVFDSSSQMVDWLISIASTPITTRLGATS